jgi:hypothetical protein
LFEHDLRAKRFAFVAREYRFPLFRIMLWAAPTGRRTRIRSSIKPLPKRAMVQVGLALANGAGC